MAFSKTCQAPIYAKLHSVAGEVRVDGRQVVLLRERRGWKPTELARQAGIDQSVVWRIENGEAKNPRLESVVALAGALGVPVESLLVGGAQPDSVTLLRQAIERIEAEREAQRLFEVLASDTDAADRDRFWFRRLEQMVEANPLLGEIDRGDIAADEPGSHPSKAVEHLIAAIDQELKRLAAKGLAP